MSFRRNFVNFFSDVKNGLSFMLGNRVQNIERVNSDVDLWVVEPNESVVKENVKPLLSESLFVGNEECVAGIDDLIFFQEFLKGLHNFDSQLEIVPAVSVYELTDILSLRRRLSDDGAVVPKEMAHEEFAEVFLELCHSHLGSAVGGLDVVSVDLHRHVLAHVHCVGEAVVDWVQFLEHH